MTTETTTSLPPCPLPDCEGGDHHYHDAETYAAEIDKEHDCASWASIGYRCYGPHQPGLSEPINLPEITAEMVESARSRSMYDTFGNLRSFAVGIRAALLASIPQWQPIEHDQIRAGMRIRATAQWDDRVIAYVGVAHHQGGSGSWYTERRWPLTGWSSPTTYEVDPATIHDPDAELIDALRDASWLIENSGERPDPLPGLPEARDLLNRLRELGWTVIRESEVSA